MSAPLPISGYILAGGRSTRMGADKATLQLGGKSLAERAVATLAPICERVRIVTDNPALASIAPTISDAFLDCGPLGGIEAALRDTQHDRILVLPVDLPFLPSALLRAWASQELSTSSSISYLEADGQPQPHVCLLHRSLLPQVQQSLRAGRYKLMRVYQEIAAGALHQVNLDDIAWIPTPLDRVLQPLWFANLNTSEELACAESALRAAPAMGY